MDDLDRLHALQLRAEAGALTDAESEELVELLLSDAEAFEDYLADLHLQAGLSWQLSGLRQSTDYFDAEMQAAQEGDASAQADRSVWEQVVDQALESRRQHELEDEANRQLAAQQAEEVRRQRYKLRRAQPQPARQPSKVPPVVVWLGVAAVLGLAAMVITQLTPKTSAPTPTIVKDRPERGPDTQPSPAPVVASLVRTLDARWDTNPAGWDGGYGLRQGSHRLTRGLAEIELASGTRVVLEAPVSFELTGSNAMTLTDGRLVAHVPPSGVGFTVDTLTARIIDYGTEFGVFADGSSRTEVHVIEGLIKLESGRGASHFESQTVQAGSAYLVSDGGIPVKVEDRPGAFYRGLPDSYERLIRDAEPLVYWRFNTIDLEGQSEGLGQLASDLVGMRDSDIRQVSPVAEGHAGHSLWLDQLTSGFQSARPVGLDTQGPFTIEAWVWVPNDTNRKMRLISNNEIGPDGIHTGGFGFGVDGGTQARALAAGPALIFTGYNVASICSQTAVPTNRWVHVAVSYDGRGGMAMFIDGATASIRMLDTGFSGATRMSIQPGTDRLRIGSAPIQPTTRTSEHWIGGLDEVAVYDRQLDSATILAHAQLVIHGDSRPDPPTR